MTPEEQSIADDKMRAKIAKLISDDGNIGVRELLGPTIFAILLMGIGAAMGFGLLAAAASMKICS